MFFMYAAIFSNLASVKYGCFSGALTSFIRLIRHGSDGRPKSHNICMAPDPIRLTVSVQYYSITYNTQYHILFLLVTHPNILDQMLILVFEDVWCYGHGIIETNDRYLKALQTST